MIKDKSSGHVYLIHSASGHYKIGMTYQEPEKRLSNLISSCPFKLTLVHAIACRHPRAIEQYLHEHFAMSRMCGEWFVLGDNEVAWLCWLRDIEEKHIPEEKSYFAYKCEAADADVDFHEAFCERLPLWGPL